MSSLGHKGATPGGDSPVVRRRRDFAFRVIEEVEVAAGLLGVSERELCRRAGYNPSYLANVKADLARGAVAAKNGSRSWGVTLRFLSDVEDAWGIKFDITVIHHPKEGP